jgi:hypothetical protein
MTAGLCQCNRFLISRLDPSLPLATVDITANKASIIKTQKQKQNTHHKPALSQLFEAKRALLAGPLRHDQYTHYRVPIN